LPAPDETASAVPTGVQVKEAEIAGGARESRNAISQIAQRIIDE